MQITFIILSRYFKINFKQPQEQSRVPEKPFIVMTAVVAVSVGTNSLKHSRHSFFDDPSFPIGAPRSPSLLLAHMLTGEREIPTQDDLFSSEFSPSPFPHFTVNGQCLSVNSLLHHSPSNWSPKNSSDKATQTHTHAHKHTCARTRTHTHTCFPTVLSVPVLVKWKNFLRL